MITTKLQPIQSGFSSKHICPLTEELKSIRNQLDSIADKYGHFYIDLKISCYGQSINYHVTATSIDFKFEAVGNSLELLEKNFREELSKYEEMSYGSFLNSLFTDMFKPNNSTI